MISNACWRKVCFQEVSLPKQKQHGAINDCKFQWKIIVRGRAKTMNWNSPPRGEADTYAASVCECAWKSATCERLWSKITSNKTIPSYTYFREYSTYKTVDKMCKNTKKTQEKTRNKQTKSFVVPMRKSLCFFLIQQLMWCFTGRRGSKKHMSEMDGP